MNETQTLIQTVSDALTAEGYVHTVGANAISMCGGYILFASRIGNRVSSHFGDDHMTLGYAGKDDAEIVKRACAVGSWYARKLS